MIGRCNVMGGGGGIKGAPAFTYTGNYSLLDDGDGNWRIKFLSSGTLTFSKLGTGNGLVDLFCVGGGGGGSTVADAYGNRHNGCGAGGYTTTIKSIYIAKNQEYAVIIGNGGSGDSAAGGASSIIGGNVNIVANGGGAGTSGPYSQTGGSGGSGGGAGGVGFSDWGTGGVDGSNGNSGNGQLRTTREFEDADGTLYASGGGANLVDGTSNSGNGWRPGLDAKAGIAIIRNHR